MAGGQQEVTRSKNGESELRIRTDAERWTPFFGYDLRKTGHACFCKAIVGLSSSTLSARSPNELFLMPYALPLIPLVLLILMMFLGSPSLTLKYGATALTSLNGAVLCKAIMVSHCLSVIWPRSMATNHSLFRNQLLKYGSYLVYYSIPGKASVVDYDVNLGPSEFGGFFHKLVNVLCIQHIARHRYCLSTSVINGFCDCVRLGCPWEIHQLSGPTSESYSIATLWRSTGIYILHHNLCALMCENLRSFCPNALA